MESLAYEASEACLACVVYQEIVASGTGTKVADLAATSLLVHLVENSIEAMGGLAIAES